MSKSYIIHYGLLVLLIGSRILYTLYGIIPDCDEVFNYYEPLNLLVRGFGKQTWEYSPEFSIRSYSYLLPLYLILKPINFVFKSSLSFENFYLIRLILASFNIFSIWKLFQSINSINNEISIIFVIWEIFNTGESHSSINLVPSSFSLNCINLFLANFIQYQSTRSLSNAIWSTFWLSLGGLIGWPFVLIFGILPMIIILLQNLNNFKQLRKYVINSTFIIIGILSLIVSIDWVFYKKLEIIPLNIVLYNVINSNDQSGPNIFGVEPFSYYIKNILINFNFIGITGYLSILIIPIFQLIFKEESLINFVVIIELFVWSIIFGSQPHKEERFLYPIYSLINLSSSIFFHKFFKIIYLLTKSKKFQSIIKLLTISIIVIISTLKSISLSLNYSAPLYIYQDISQQHNQGNIENVCVGREWYRYPSSFFLSNDQRLKFIKSQFNGLLPGDFKENDLLKATSEIPLNMNQLNLFENDKIVGNFVENCEFIIDIDQPFDSNDDEINEQDLIDNFQLISSLKFLNNEKSQGIGKFFKIPTSLNEITNTKLIYHNYNLYKKRTSR
ncbi:hypothetical protein WICMUC_004270 [Wickerhamomyces mucosus]|uniref:Mannosyltransferase n=1 Tax=Wickerhamomyces mucosus TaxID=1378264 RepID=A0A9P8PJG5_9ASCO|nr:hypothetical protein WICMUC_004270 [Wickerhamomyces mucosus]